MSKVKIAVIASKVHSFTISGDIIQIELEDPSISVGLAHTSANETLVVSDDRDVERMASDTITIKTAATA